MRLVEGGGLAGLLLLLVAFFEALFLFFDAAFFAEDLEDGLAGGVADVEDVGSLVFMRLFDYLLDRELFAEDLLYEAPSLLIARDIVRAIWDSQLLHALQLLWQHPLHFERTLLDEIDKRHSFFFFIISPPFPYSTLGLSKGDIKGKSFALVAFET